MKEKRLTRKRDDRMLFGVASGVAEYIGVDPAIVRLLFVLMALINGWGLLIYVVLAIIMPEQSSVAAKAHPFDEEEIVINDAS